jgi:hypothetical protein
MGVIRGGARGSFAPFGANGVHGLHPRVHDDECAAGQIVFFSAAIFKWEATFQVEKTSLKCSFLLYCKLFQQVFGSAFLLSENN